MFPLNTLLLPGFTGSSLRKLRIEETITLVSRADVSISVKPQKNPYNTDAVFNHLLKCKTSTNPVI